MALAPHFMGAGGRNAGELALMAGHLAQSPYPAGAREHAAIDRLLSEVRRHRQALAYAEPHVRYERSPFKTSASPLQVTSVVRSKRHSHAPGYESS